MIQLETPIKINPKWIQAAGGQAALAGFYIPIRKKKNTPPVIPLRLSRQEKRILRKKKPMPVSEWAERHRVLPQDAPIPGPWRNRNVPYIAGVMDASFFSSVQEIVVCAAPQAAKTEGVMTCLGYAADRKPGNMMIVFPDENTAKETNKDRLQPMFRDSRRLRSYKTRYVDDESGLRINLQHLRIYMAWANSASRLASKPLPYVFLDEVDKFPVTANKKESGPIDLARKRTRNFAHMRKIWITSSPTIEIGAIWVALNESQVIFDYFVRCPECHAVQKMTFEQIKWPEGSDADPNRVESGKLAWYVCAHCAAKWDDAARDKAVRAGEWRHRDKGTSLMTTLKSIRPIRIGFHIPAWLSPFVSLSECAAAFIRGLTDKTKLKDFLNGTAAEPWKAVSQSRTEDRILALRDDRPRSVVPGGGKVACILAGVDTQDDGFWYEIRAFGYGLGFDSWGIREGFVPSFEGLKEILWVHEYKDVDGNPYPVYLTCQDAMGHRTSEVYLFCQQHRGLIFPTKGEARLAQPISYTNLEFFPPDAKGRKRPIPGGLQLLRLDTNFFKNKLSSILEVANGDPGCWYYHSEVTRDWARQMTVEGINEKGLWENPNGKPNHGWDCSVLLLMAHEMLGVGNWPKPEPEAVSTDKKKSGQVARSKFITGG